MGAGKLRHLLTSFSSCFFVFIICVFSFLNFSDEENERGVPLMQLNGSSDKHAESEAITSDEDYDPHLFRVVQHPTT